MAESNREQTTPNPHKGHRERVRRRFLNEGLENFESHNILELLLFYTVPQKDTNELAHQLLDRFGSLSEVFNAPVEQLTQVKGISEYSASLIALVPQLFRAYACDMASQEKPFGREGIANFMMTQLAGLPNERVLLAYVDNTGYMISFTCISEGSLDTSIISKRDIVEKCLHARATAAVLAHNHPRGSAYPSKQDVDCTMYVKKALEVIDIRLLDHFIIGLDDCYSMASDDDLREMF